MLSRVANCLYWMSRYIERADNIARILDVNLQMLLDYRSMDEVQSREHWLPIIQTTGDHDAFLARSQGATAAAVAEFMVFAGDNPNSLVSSVCQARENARMVRDQITVESWIELNRLFLYIQSPQARQTWQESPADFFNEIKNSSLLLGGLSAATHIRNEGWWFSQAGRLIERADKTSRILDIRYHTLPPRGLPKSVTQAEALGWTAILRSCSAWDAYKSIYGGEVHPRLVTEFLLLNEGFPRSVLFCVYQLNEALRRISGVAPGRFSNEAEKLAGRLVAELQFSTVEEIFENGLHDYLDTLQLKLNDIGDALFNTYISYAFLAGGECERVQQEEQQQQASGPASRFRPRPCRHP